MNDERFIEMLNLYIDRELVGEEVNEIEEAIASSPERQRIYAQYCKMQQATAKLLAGTQVPQPHIDELVAAAESDSGSLVEFPAGAASRSRRASNGWNNALTGLAAACVALMVYVGVSKDDSDAPVAATAQPTPQVAPVIFVADSADDAVYKTVFVLNQEGEDARLPGMRGVDDSFAWMTQLQFAPIERTELDSWEMKTADPIEVRSLKTQWISPDMPQAMTAFQFQR
ncbi:MAG: hypothetical protein SynsKO_17420 [Synoicihabitans sp.]